jgi:hypothetical protein
MEAVFELPAAACNTIFMANSQYGRMERWCEKKGVNKRRVEYRGITSAVVPVLNNEVLSAG